MRRDVGQDVSQAGTRINLRIGICSLEGSSSGFIDGS